MSATQWDWSLASADGLLTNEECLILLDTDILESDKDLLKNFPQAANKIASGLSEFQTHEDVSSPSMYSPSPIETKPDRAQLANELLLQLDGQCKQENLFPNWLEEKAELPIFENISNDRIDVPLSGAPVAVPVLPLHVPVAQYHQPQPTEELLREFETVYGAVELNHLTPPQSPPTALQNAQLTLAEYLPSAEASPASWAAPCDLEHELQAVDELVRHRASQFVSPGSSPHSSPPSSPRSSTTDEEWCVPSSRSKPYSRGGDDRRSRKKEQNKNAATRYRQKKKAEVEVLLNEEQNLRSRHTDLGNKCSDLQREIRYLKGLMRDLFKAKGLIK